MYVCAYTPLRNHKSYVILSIELAKSKYFNSYHLISCSSSSNSAVEKKVPKLISSPSQSFFIVMTEISLLLLSNIL